MLAQACKTHSTRVKVSRQHARVVLHECERLLRSHTNLFHVSWKKPSHQRPKVICADKELETFAHFGRWQQRTLRFLRKIDADFGGYSDWLEFAIRSKCQIQGGPSFQNKFWCCRRLNTPRFVCNCSSLIKVIYLLFLTGVGLN